MRRTDLDALHPIMRSATSRLLQLLQAEQLPFRLFEAFRGPARQAWLYAQGRTLPGSIVTNSQPWDSYHQYGLAADFVLWLNNQWSWSIDGAYQFYWKRLRDIGTTCGLEPLEFEAPHLQVMNLQIANLRNGIFPDGDDEWRDNLEATIVGWTGQPAAPTISSSRPPL